MVVAVGFLTIALALGLASGQSLDCNSLNVERTAAPLSGSSLGECRTSADQCCTQAYLDKVRKDVGEDLLDGLRDELEEQVESVEELVETLGMYFEVQLVSLIRDNLPLVSFYRDHVASVTERLTNLLSRQRFGINSTSSPEVNTTQVIIDIIDGIKLIIRNSSFTDDQKTCLVSQLDQNLKLAVVRELGRNLEEVRRAYTLVIRIFNFLRNFNRTLSGFDVSDFPRECISTAIDISFCGRCTRVLPPLCSNTCGALVRGCYAAFFSGLRNEFNNLWNVTRQAINIMDRGVLNIEEDENNIYDSTVLSRAVFDCGITVGGKKKRQATRLPSEVFARARNFSGVFTYGRSGPEFCEVESEEEDYCRRGRSEDERVCDSNEVCTSSCQCWNGNAMSRNNTAAFNGSGIDEQESNPVLKVSKEEYEAVAIKLGTPVNAFLTSSEFKEVAPENVTVPDANPYSGGQAPVMVSMATLVVAMVLVLML